MNEDCLTHGQRPFKGFDVNRADAGPVIDLSGRVALVTGGSKGIGAACAVRLAQAGADVVVNYLTSRNAAEAVATRITDLGRRTAIVKADVSRPEDVAEMVGFIQESFQRLDTVVSCAASGGFRPVLETTPGHLTAAVSTNATALLSLVKTCLPLLERTGSRSKVMAISSHGARSVIPSYATVGASKAAMEALVRYLAYEVGLRGVNVNVILSGLVETDSTRGMADFEGRKDASNRRNLVGRALTPADVADVALYLASDLSDMIQGQTLVVDAGYSVSA